MTITAIGINVAHTPFFEFTPLAQLIPKIPNSIDFNNEIEVYDRINQHKNQKVAQHQELKELATATHFNMGTKSVLFMKRYSGH